MYPGPDSVTEVLNDFFGTSLVPLYANHELCTDCYDVSWNANVLWGASAYAQIAERGAGAGLQHIPCPGGLVLDRTNTPDACCMCTSNPLMPSWFAHAVSLKVGPSNFVGFKYVSFCVMLAQSD
eukprot:1495805-Pyramimonas_sp.AAC.1